MSNPMTISQIESWLVEGDHAQAKEGCLDLLAEHPNDPDLGTLLAVAEELGGELDAALERLELVANHHPEHVRTLFHLARLKHQKGDDARAMDLIDQCIALSPNHAPSRALLARLEHRAGRVDRAIDALKVALKADAEYLPALCDLAVLLVEVGELEQADQYARQAVKIDPDEAGAQLALGVVLEAQGHLSFAEQCLTNATETDPNAYQGLMALARIYQKQQRHQEALATLDRLSESQKATYSAQFARAFSLVRLGQLAPARAVYEQIMTDRPDGKTLLQLMDLYIQLNDHQALVDLSSTVDRSESGVDEAAQFLDARLAEFQGNFDEALKILEAITDTTRKELLIRVRLVMARIALKKGEPDVALVSLKALAEHALLAHPVRWEMAQLAEAAGDRALALRMVDAVLADESLDSTVQGRTATMRLHLLDRLERFEEAKSMIAQNQTTMGWLPVPGPLMSSALPVMDGNVFPKLSEAGSARPIIWVAGWPWAGRELVLAALAQLDGAQVLPLAEGQHRHQHLGLMPGEPYHLAIDADQAHQMRRRYLRGASEGAKILIEPYPCKAADLIRMRQVFPEAIAVRVICDPNYLSLQWHLAGYAQVDTMLEAWRAEQVALDHLEQYDELSVIPVALSDLLDPEVCESAIESWMASIGQSANRKMAAHVQALVQRHGYRSADHWKHYV